MKIAIDIRCLGAEKITGVGIYAQHLTRALLPCSDVDLWLPWRKRRNAHRVRERLGVEPNTKSEWTRLFSAPDLVFGPDFKCPRFGAFKKVITIHDVVEFETEFMNTKFMAQARENMTRTLSRNRPDHIIAVSDFTKERIHAAYPELRIPITRVHHGVDHFVPTVREESQRPHGKPYVLCVGTIETRKNQVSLVEAFHVYKAQNPDSDLDLVLIGGAGPGSEKVGEAIERSPVRGNIHWLRSAPHAQLAIYYAFAEAMVFPTLYEGFGFPILETMRSETPVITSPFGAMKEVAGPAALYANPRDPHDLARAMKELLSNPSLAQDLRTKGLARARQFTWDRCATETLQVFTETLNRS